jgi:hypothetical protein
MSEHLHDGINNKVHMVKLLINIDLFILALDKVKKNLRAHNRFSDVNMEQ